MYTSSNNNSILSGLSGILAAVTVTAILFTALPLLSQVEIIKKRTTQGARIFINSPKPPPPPEPEKEKEKNKPEVKKIKSYKSKQTTKTKPKFDFPSFSKAGDIEISSIIQPEFNISSFEFATEFDLSEVDTVPVVRVQSQPVYPYNARRSGIDGIVSVRFLVTKEGEVERVSIIRAEPEGVFDEATRKCVSRWRFNPGIKNGEAVDTWVEIDIEFELERT